MEVEGEACSITLLSTVLAFVFPFNHGIRMAQNTT